MTPSVDDLLRSSRRRINRIKPEDLSRVTAAGGIVIDIRPVGQREEEGALPGAIVVDRNVLEWRLDPTSSARIPAAVDHDIEVVVFCSEGYTSSLAASSLQDLGLHSATDLDGGFHAWKRAGLPVSSPAEAPPGASPER